MQSIERYTRHGRRDLYIAIHLNMTFIFIYLLFLSHFISCLKFLDLKRRLLADGCEDQPARPQDFTYVSDSSLAEKKRRLHEYDMFSRGTYQPPTIRSLPGHRRLSSTELLLRIFPKMKINVLQLVLQACGGDVIQAIEQILAKHKPENNPFSPTNLSSLEGHDLAKEFQLRSESFQFPRNTTNFFSNFHSSAFSPVSIYPKYQTAVGAYPLKTRCHGEPDAHRHNLLSYHLESRDFLSPASTTAGPLHTMTDEESEKREKSTESS